MSRADLVETQRESKRNLEGIQRESREDLEEIQAEFRRNLGAIARVLKNMRKTNEYNRN